MNAAPLKTSETWLLLVAGVLQTLVHTGVIPETASAAINAVCTAIIPMLFQTIFRKVRDGQKPFVNPSSTK